MSERRKFIITSLLFSGFLLIGGILYAQYTATVALEKGLQYCLASEYDKAIRAFNKAIRLNPYLARAYNGRGLAYSYEDNFDQAIADYNKSIELNPNDASININRAVAYYFKRQYDKAWQDVYLAESFGIKPDEKFIESLKKASMRER